MGNVLYFSFATFYLIFTFLLIGLGVENEWYKKYGGRNPKKFKGDEKEKFGIATLILLAYALFSVFVTLLFMFWTASKGIIIGKYYAFTFLGFIFLNFIFSKIKNKKTIPKRKSLMGRLHITSILEIMITLYALWVLI